MEPEIPSGSYCLFRPLEGRSPEGRTVMVRSSEINDRCQPMRGYRHTRITPAPRNPEFAPIVLTPGDEGAVQVVVEIVGVLS